LATGAWRRGRSSSQLNRRRGTREVAKRYLVLCEGRVTEVDYLKFVKRALRGSLIDIHISNERELTSLFRIRALSFGFFSILGIRLRSLALKTRVQRWRNTLPVIIRASTANCYAGTTNWRAKGLCCLKVDMLATGVMQGRIPRRTSGV
jgi:hypothetical protein